MSTSIKILKQKYHRALIRAKIIKIERDIAKLERIYGL